MLLDRQRCQEAGLLKTYGKLILTSLIMDVKIPDDVFDDGQAKPLCALSPRELPCLLSPSPLSPITFFWMDGRVVHLLAL